MSLIKYAGVPTGRCLTAAEELPGAIAAPIADTNGITTATPYRRDWLNAAVDVDRHYRLVASKTA